MIEYSTKSIIPIIESKYDSFTTVEKSIADFFIHNNEKTDYSAKAIAERLFVSEASLSRFAKKCGYRGYREFIYQYEKVFVERKTDMIGNTKMILDVYQEILNKAYNLVDETQIARISKYMNRAEQVYVCGNGSSGLAASEMEFRFMRVGVNIDSIQDSHRMKMQAVFLNQKNLVFGISISGTSEAVLYMLKEAHERGAKTVLLTATSSEVFTEFCDEVVLVPSVRHLNCGNIISPQFPALLMIDLIYYNFVENDKYEKESLHDCTLQALYGNGLAGSDI